MLHNSKTALLLSVLLLIPAYGQTEKRTSPAKPAATPEEAFERMVQAGQAGDFDGVFAVFVEDERRMYREAFLLGKSLFTAMQATRRAIDERFGKEPGAKPPVDFKQLEKEGAAIFGQTGLVGKEVKGDNKVVLKVKGTPWPPDGTDEYIAVKEADGWKLKSPEGIDLKKFEHKKAFFEAQKQVCVRITKEVKEGKYETRREAERAMAEALARVAKEYL